MHPPAPSPPPGRPLSRWIKVIALILILLGIGFRSTNLDLKPFWEDEVYAITRVSGYRLWPVFSQDLDQQRLTVKDLEKYRDPRSGQSWTDMMLALAGATEHTPLYFLALRVWSGIVGHSTAALRALSVLCSVVGIGVFYLLGRSLFPTDRPLGDAAGWGSMTLASLSPLLLRYAQETRSYSLWMIGLGLSTWALLRAWRSPSQWNWCIYGLTLLLAFYTHLLTLFVIVSHGIALIIHGCLNRWQQTPFKAWILTTLASGLFMSPWLALIVYRQGIIRARMRWLTTSQPLDSIVRAWGRGFSSTWLEIPIQLQSVWYLVALAALIGIAIATVYLWRHSQPNSIITILSFALIPTLTILAMDLLSGGHRSTINRYFIPAYVGLLTLSGSALGCMLAGRVGQQRLSAKNLGLWSGTALLLLISTLSMGQLHRAPTWWGWSSFIPTFTRTIQKEPDAILITDYRVGAFLPLAYALPPEQKLMWINPDVVQSTPRLSLPIADNEGIFLFAPSKELQQIVKAQRQRSRLAPIEQDKSPTLWFMPPSPPEPSPRSPESHG